MGPRVQLARIRPQQQDCQGEGHAQVQTTPHHCRPVLLQCQGGEDKGRHNAHSEADDLLRACRRRQDAGPYPRPHRRFHQCSCIGHGSTLLWIDLRAVCGEHQSDERSGHLRQPLLSRRDYRVQEHHHHLHLCPPHHQHARYKISKVVFRGFHSSDALQAMHDKVG